MGPHFYPPDAVRGRAPLQRHRWTPTSFAQHYPTHPADHNSQRLGVGVFFCFFFCFFCFFFLALYKL
jgi:uncharacterized membrane protein YccC